MDIIEKVKATMSRLCSRRPVRVPAEGRRGRRVSVGLDARLKIREESVVRCVVTDATSEGVGLTLSDPLPPGSIAVVEIPFNGRRLRTGMQIRWIKRHGDRIEAGGSFLRGADEKVARNFSLYLRWCEAYHQAA